MRDPNKLRHISQWLLKLYDLTRSFDPVTPNIVAQLTEFLAEDFKSETFNDDSLKFVAGAFPRSPVYAEIYGSLMQWRSENQRAPYQSLPNPNATLADKLTGMDREWYTYWQTRKGEDFGPVKPNEPPSGRKRVESLIRQQSWPAWLAICEDEGVVTEHRKEATDAEREYVAGMLRADRERVDHNEQQAKPEEQRPEPRHLSPEQLAAAYKKDNLTAPERPRSRFPDE